MEQAGQVLSYIGQRKNLLGRGTETPHAMLSGPGSHASDAEPRTLSQLQRHGLGQEELVFSLSVVYCSCLKGPGCETSLVSVVWFGLEMPFDSTVFVFFSCEFPWEEGDADFAGER